MSDTLHNDAYKTLIERLIKARTIARMSQQAVADKLGKPQSYVAKVEGFERRLDVIELLTIAKVIGFNPMPAIKEVWTTLNT